MLQIQPEREIVVEFIRSEDYKYVRCLGAFYLRLTGKPLEVYEYLEPLLNDYRKIRYATPQGKFQVRHVDEFVHDLLSKDFACDIALPRIRVTGWCWKTRASSNPGGARSRTRTRAHSRATTRSRGTERIHRGTAGTGTGGACGRRARSGERARRAPCARV